MKLKTVKIIALRISSDSTLCNWKWFNFLSLFNSFFMVFDNCSKTFIYFLKNYLFKSDSKPTCMPYLLLITIFLKIIATLMRPFHFVPHYIKIIVVLRNEYNHKWVISHHVFYLNCCVQILHIKFDVICFYSKNVFNELRYMI